jgi:hypothetical protein
MRLPIIILAAFFSGLSVFSVHAASVVSSQVISDQQQADGSRIVLYEFELLDNNGGSLTVDYGPKTVDSEFNTTADLVVLAPRILQSQADYEIEAAIFRITDLGEDPLHYDAGGGNWQKETPNWNTWDVLFTAVAKYFWAQTDQLTLAPYSDSWGRVSNQDKTNLLGITNQTRTAMAGDMQTAVDTLASLASYAPYFDEDGTYIGP